MEVEGIIIAVLPVQNSVEGAAKAWSKQDFIIETEGQYPKKVCINSFNGKIPSSQLVVGSKMKVDVNLESREFNGKWYTTVSAWKAELIGSAAQTQPSQQAKPAPFPVVSENPVDDLPFS